MLVQRPLMSVFVMIIVLLTLLSMARQDGITMSYERASTYSLFFIAGMSIMISVALIWKKVKRTIAERRGDVTMAPEMSPPMQSSGTPALRCEPTIISVSQLFPHLVTPNPDKTFKLPSYQQAMFLAAVVRMERAIKENKENCPSYSSFGRPANSLAAPPSYHSDRKELP